MATDTDDTCTTLALASGDTVELQLMEAGTVAATTRAPPGLVADGEPAFLTRDEALTLAHQLFHFAVTGALPPK